MKYNRCGRSGLLLPACSLGFWFNFGRVDDFKTARSIVLRAFESGVTHFDLANNYGPPPGSAEQTLGKILRKEFAGRRDQLVLSTKAGYRMWPGPYGDGGSKKYLTTSLDQSLKRLGSDYVDIFYHHRPDPETPMEETMGALDLMVRRGKALHVGLSSYTPEQTASALKILKELGTPCLIHQPAYSLLQRGIEEGLLDLLGREGVGCAAFLVLAQGMLTGKYLQGIPKNSRAAKPHTFLKPEDLKRETLERVGRLQKIAVARGQSLARMAIAWVLRDARVTTAIVGASSVGQLDDNLGALENPDFSADELRKIDQALG